MAEITRAPATAAEAEAQLKTGVAQPTVTPPTDSQPENGPGPIQVPRGLIFKLKGKGDAEAEATLLDGRVVTLKTPEVATQFIQARILAAAMPNAAGGYPQELKYQVTALMYVYSINGNKVIRPSDYPEAQKLMNELGDEGMNVVAAAYVNHYVAREIPLPL